MKQIKLRPMIRILIHSLIVIIINVIVEGKAMSKDEYVTLYFVTPFSMETYVPVTSENIEDDSHKVWISKDHSVITDLLKAFQLTRTLKPINEKAIRIKANFDDLGGLFLIDRQGIVFRKKDGQRFEISEQELIDVESVLQKMIGIVDVKAHERFRSGK